MPASVNHDNKDTEILRQAADWLIQLQSGDIDQEQQRALHAWQQQTPKHAATWARAMAMLDTFASVPEPIAKATLAQAGMAARRRNLKLLGVLLVSAPTAWMASRQEGWQSWTADYQTAKGQQKTIHLDDGSILVLNTGSAVNVAFTETERRITLVSGEILMTTGKHPGYTDRPLVVHTRQGRMRALGTRFVVRAMEGGNLTRLDVFEGAVEVQPLALGQTRIVHSGQQQVFSGTAMQAAGAANAGNMLWQQGMLLAREMPLGALIGELGRYRRGVLRCDPSVAALPISGAFSLTDIDASLQLLGETFPIRIRRFTPLWLTVTKA